MTDTLVSQFFFRAHRFPHRIALRRRTATGWQDISWQSYAQSVQEVAAGLWARGIRPADKVGLLSSNRPEWLYADLAILSLGAVSVPIYTTLVPSQMQHIIAHSQMRLLIVEDASQMDKVMQMQAACPYLEQLVIIEPNPHEPNPHAIADTILPKPVLQNAAQAGEAFGGHGGGHAGHPSLSWDTLCAQGRTYLAAHPETIQQAQSHVQPDLLASLVYTSGTTGPAKGVMLSHRNLITQAQRVHAHVPFLDQEETLSFLPLSHIAERLQGELMAIEIGFTVNFAQSLETVSQDLEAVRPTLLLCVPRLWEKFYEGIQDKVKQAGLLRRLAFQGAVGVGAARWNREIQGRRIGLGLTWLSQLADKKVAAPLRKRLGLDRSRLLISAAAPLAPAIQRFFAALGLPIVEAYGLTECAGISHGTFHPRWIKPGKIGPSLSGLEVRLMPDGELCMRGDQIFMGYFQDEDATRQAMVDGWFHTGDMGEIDTEGYFRITDRKKDIIVTSGGKNVAPQNIENQLKSHRGISQAVVLGDKRKFLVALITMERSSLTGLLGRPAGERLSEDPAIYTYVQKVIDQVNQGLSRYETIKRFKILNKDFSIESGELTPTLKVKRRMIDERYQNVIEELY